MSSHRDEVFEEKAPLSLKIARIGIFSSLYVVFTLIPVSKFIGGPGFITLNIICPAMFSLLFPFKEALFIALIGGFLAGFTPTEAMFGLLWIFLPVTGVIIGSLVKATFEGKKVFTFVPLIFFGIIAYFYLRIHIAFPYWIVPHLVAGLLVVLVIFMNVNKWGEIKRFVVAFNATMGEQAAMLMIAVYIMNLPTEVFMIAFPLMAIWERLILGTIVATMITKVVERRLEFKRHN